VGYPDHIHLHDQQELVVWIQEEPHTDIAVLQMDPRPTETQVPQRVSMEWAILDLEYDGPGRRVYVWRLVGVGVRAWSLHGEWDTRAHGYAAWYQAPSPIHLKLTQLPGDLFLHCESIVIDALGWRTVGS